MSFLFQEEQAKKSLEEVNLRQEMADKFQVRT